MSLALAPGAASSAEPPPHLQVVRAAIEEVPPVNPRAVPGRQVRFTLRVAGTPACTPDSPSLSYGFLIDSDKSTATGRATRPFGDLGVDARISARCDPLARAFVSDMGPVSVTVDPTGETTFEILVLAADLPSIDFWWFAFAQENTSFSRLPQEMEHAAWAVSERALD